MVIENIKNLISNPHTDCTVPGLSLDSLPKMRPGHRNAYLGSNLFVPLYGFSGMDISGAGVKAL